MIQVGGKVYEIVKDHKNGWNLDAFRDRFSEVLERYDYIVGDWGYSQLRLRGFFRDTHPKVTKESSISSLQDYLNEYCNFGCAYFIVEKVNGNKAQQKQQDNSQPQDTATKDIEPKPS
ncbi:YutD family protein [Paenibacillus sp. KN14-4R]|uniref:YutD family protein n=1 Tax=Paenibacillus sp. KN14-4R TaxID=3445773 RepID=UPI003FA0E40C